MNSLIIENGIEEEEKGEEEEGCATIKVFFPIKELLPINFKAQTVVNNILKNDKLQQYVKE